MPEHNGSDAATEGRAALASLHAKFEANAVNRTAGAGKQTMSNVATFDPKKKKAHKAPAPQPPPRRPTLDEWMSTLVVNAKSGAPKATIGNVEIVLRNDDRYAGTFSRNAMSAAVEHTGDPLPDEAFTRVRIDIERRYGFAPNEDAVVKAITMIASEKNYHPVERYLRSLEHDGTLRIDRVAERILGAAVSPLHVAYLRKWFVGMVARAMKPGTKVDTALVLVGQQGVGKSTFFRELTAPWFTDSGIDLQNKDASMVLGVSWCLEWPELDSMSRSTRDRVKAFMSQTDDTFRAPYAKAVIKVPRTALIVGTTNEDTFLRDPTGSRRFWPLPVMRVDVAALRQHKDQLWAEAVLAYDAGEIWYLSDDEDRLREDEAPAFTQEDAWEGAVLSWANGKLPFTVAEVLEGALDMRAKDFTRADEMRVAEILRRAGYERTPQKRVGGVRVRQWAPPSQPPQPVTT